MKRIRFMLCLALLVGGVSLPGFAQEIDHAYAPVKVNLSEDGTKFVHFINWHQFWLTADNHPITGDLTVRPSLRRSRFLMFAQISPKFLILTHFGINSFGADQMNGIGQGRAQLFLHDAWAEYEVMPKKLYLGGGLHYWNGISRLTNQSTLNFLPLDMPRFNWPTINTTDQFARHMGVYAKGKIGKLDYRLAVNEAMTNGVDGAVAINDQFATVNAKARSFGTQGSLIYQGYLNFQFMDQESNKLPYMVGTYLGQKTVFNLGAGFYTNPGGAVTLTNAANPLDGTLADPAAILADFQAKTTSHNVTLLGVDAFYDAPVGSNGGAVTAYAVYYNYDFGPNFLYARGETIGTGGIVYGHVGYLIPGEGMRNRVQPYASFSNRSFEQFQDAAYANTSANTLGLGVNYMINGHHSKLTLEWQRSQSALSGEGSSFGRMQYVVFL